MLRGMLPLAKIEFARKHVSTRIKKMGIEALYCKANTSRQNLSNSLTADPCVEALE